MNNNSIPPPPAPEGARAGDGMSWGRSRSGVDSNSLDVTGGLLLVEPSPHTGDLTQRTNAAHERAQHLAQLRAPGPWPTPAGPARRAQPGEMPRAALTVRDAAVTPWATSCWYAPAGSVPYTFERRQAGYLLTPLAYVRFRHPDGRYAVGIWIRDQMALRGRGNAKEWTLTWSYAEGWRWRGGPNGTFPQPIDATTLKAAVKDGTYRAQPYVLEEPAA